MSPAKREKYTIYTEKEPRVAFKKVTRITRRAVNRMGKIMDFSILRKGITYSGTFGIKENTKEAVALMELERAGVKNVPKLLAFNDKCELTTTVLSGIEGNNSDLIIPDLTTAAFIAFKYIGIMEEVYNAGFLNLDQGFYNVMIGVDSDRIPLDVSLFDMAADVVSKGKIKLRPNLYEQDTKFPPEVTKLNFLHISVPFKADTLFLYTVNRFLLNFFQKKYRDVFEEDKKLIRLIIEGMTDDPNKRKDLSRLKHHLMELIKGKDLLPVISKEKLKERHIIRPIIKDKIAVSEQVMQELTKEIPL